jgi:hypothetical protein
MTTSDEPILNTADKPPSQNAETQHAHTEPHELGADRQVGQQEQRAAEAGSEREVKLARDYRQHPLGALFPRVSDEERGAWATDIRKHGQRHDIIQHPDGSILDGCNTLHAILMAGDKPRIITWDGKPGDELAFVVSQNVLRRHLNESQRATVACKLAALPKGQRKTGKFAGVPTQAEAAKLLRVSERTVRTARKVLENAPANVARLVEEGRRTLNAADALLSRISPEDKQRIEDMSDHEVMHLLEESDTGKRTTARTADNQADDAHAPTTPAVTPTADAVDGDDENDNRPIGKEAVSRALNRIEIKAVTPTRQALVRAIERLPLSDARWACELMSTVEQEARGNSE